MSRNDPSLLNLARILRLVDALDAPEREYLIARLRAPRAVPAAEPVAAPVLSAASQTPPPDASLSDPGRHPDDAPPRGFTLVDEVEKTSRVVGGKRAS